MCEWVLLAESAHPVAEMRKEEEEEDDDDRIKSSGEPNRWHVKINKHTKRMERGREGRRDDETMRNITSTNRETYVEFRMVTKRYLFRVWYAFLLACAIKMSSNSSDNKNATTRPYERYDLYRVCVRNFSTYIDLSSKQPASQSFIYHFYYQIIASQFRQWIRIVKSSTWKNINSNETHSHV